MKNNILISTTNTLENIEIESYIDLVTVNVVIGTHFFSDFGASFTDLFGGYSNTYQNKLQEIYDAAIDKLTLKATKIRANAIVGFKLDFDEISGKGKSMFMISATGTAVSVKYRKPADFIENENMDKIIPCNELDKAITNLKLRKIFNAGQIPSNEQWGYLFRNPVDEFIAPIVENYVLILSMPPFEPKSEDQNSFITNANQFFTIANKDRLADVIYEKLPSKPTTLFPIIETNKLFYPEKVISLINNDHLVPAVYCLSVHRDFYDNGDLLLMEQIIEMFNNLPDKGRIDIVKGLLLKSKEKFVCPSGHINDVDDTFCATCSKNIKGLTSNQLDEIADFAEKVEILRSLLMSSADKFSSSAN